MPDSRTSKLANKYWSFKLLIFYQTNWRIIRYFQTLDGSRYFEQKNIDVRPIA